MNSSPPISAIRAPVEFFDWLSARGVRELAAIESAHVAAYIEQLQKARSAPTAKLRLAALRHLLDWLVIGQIMPINPAAAVRGPRHIVRRGKTPVLDPAEARQLIDAIDITTTIGLRDRALIGLMVYSFARIGAAIGMNAEDVNSQNRRLWVRLHEKGGKQHAMPCHHNLEAYLHEYIDGAGLANHPKALLFQTYSRATGQLTGNPLPQANAYAMRPCCTEASKGATAPSWNHLRNADEIGLPEFTHSVERFDRDGNFGHTASVFARLQGISDDALVATDRRFNLRAPGV